MSLTPKALRQILERYPTSPRYWIAYSGGLDSHVLLHLCAQLQAQSDYVFTALHVHHGLQTVADDWVDHCRKTSAQYAMPCKIIRVDARPWAGASPEEAARNARYQAFRSILAENEVLLTAQHQNDQAETLLLQLFRGAGLAGLAAMPEYAPLPPGFILRPLLTQTRNALQTYAQTHGLNWIEDPSNQDQRYDRNFLRQDIWPRLERRWPALASTLSRTAGHCAEAQNTLDDLATEWLHKALGGSNDRLDLNVLQAHTTTEQALILRAWLKRNGLRMISARLIRQIQEEIMQARADRNPRLSWREAEIRRFRHQLHLITPPLLPVAPTLISWDGTSPLTLPDGNGWLDLERQTGTGVGIALDQWHTAAITVGYRQGGETVRLPGRKMTHELKKFLQEQGIPPWIRERLPLIYLNGKLASLAGRWTLAAYAAEKHQPSVAIRWVQSQPVMPVENR